jgi:phosphoribosylanthranilate isomerase
MKIKICGISTIESAIAAESAGAEYIGFVFFEKSPRNVTPKQAAEIATHLKNETKKVALVVDASDEFLENILREFNPDFIQLHGKENGARTLEIKNKFGKKIIKAISVESADDLKKAEEFKAIADYILFDAKPPKNSVLPGGNGVSFDWNILKNFSGDYNWILSGGLNTQNVSEAIKLTHAKFVDVSSGVESSAGVKDLEKIKEFCRNCLESK